jgi:hypothetical protein
VTRKTKVIAGFVGAAALALGSAVPAMAMPVGAGHGTLQEVPVPASGSCADVVSPGAINWSGVGSSSWSNTFTGCVRTMWYDQSQRIWYVR